MKGFHRSLITALFLLTASLIAVQAAEPMGGQPLAAMPILEQGMTQLRASVGRTECQLSISRALSAHVFVLGTASTNGTLDASLRLLAPINLAPVFLAIELTPQQVTGLMTLFFGPVSIDLGRSWFAPSRWAWFQLVVHPRLSLVVGAQQTLGRTVPRVGWRLFPTGSASWEVELTVAPDEMRLTFGGVL